MPVSSGIPRRQTFLAHRLLLNKGDSTTYLRSFYPFDTEAREMRQMVWSASKLLNVYHFTQRFSCGKGGEVFPKAACCPQGITEVQAATMGHIAKAFRLQHHKGYSCVCCTLNYLQLAIRGRQAAFIKIITNRGHKGISLSKPPCNFFLFSMRY